MVDDAHWADGRSLHFLVYLGRRIRDLPLSLILSSRGREPGTAPGILGAVTRFTIKATAVPFATDPNTASNTTPTRTVTVTP